MKIFKSILIILISIIPSIELKASYDFGLTQDIYIKLCGIWDTRIISNCRLDLSWGEAKVAINGSTIIDLGDDEPFIHVGGTNRYYITRVYKKCGLYVIRIFQPFNKKQYDIEVTLADDKKIIFNEMKWFKEFQLFVKYGENKPYYFIDGPSIKYYKTNINNLRLREEPFSNKKIIRLLNLNDKLIIIKKGKTESINGVKGTWVKILSDKNEIGWCFDVYLQPW